MSEKTPRAWDRWQKSFLLGVSAITLVTLLALRIVRIVMMPTTPTFLESIDLMLSDLFVGLGVMLASLAIIGWTKRKTLAVAILQAGHLLWLAMEGSAYNFVITTGSPLDWQLVKFTFEQSYHIWAMIQASTTLAVRVQLLFVIALVCALPWYFLYRAEEPPEEARRYPHGKLAIAGVVLIALAWTPPLVFEDRLLRRNSTINVIATGISELWSGRSEGSSDSDELALIEDAKLEPREGATERDVIVILLESTRADVTTVYTPELQTTPVLAKFAEDAMVFDLALAVMPHTSKALVATLCGTTPNPDITINEAGPRGIARRCLASLLGERGYHTAYFQTASGFFEHRYSLTKNMGYEHFVSHEKIERGDFEQPNYFGLEDLAMIGPSERWLANVPKDERVFMTYLTLMPHHDYRVPTGWSKEWGAKDETIDRYRSAVNYLDKVVEEVLALLERQGRRKDAVILIVGDHGEAFGEHGRFQHDNVLYQEALHIPLVLSGPDIPAERVARPVSQLDILPTLVHHAGFDLVGGRYPGWRLDIPWERKEMRRMFAFCWYKNRCGAVIDWPRKYIYNFDASPPELYDLREDPEEKNNLYEANQAEGLDKQKALMKWMDKESAPYQ